MTTEDIRIHIIGGGISGIIAAKTLEEFGFAPTILEGSDRLGGRVKTDVVDGYQLDRGFQVLLSNYPAAKKFLDYKALSVQEFISGAAIFKKGKKSYIGDPLRDRSLWMKTLFSNVATLGDKLKIFQLQNQLKKKSIDKIFESAEVSTMEYLRGYGFSEKIIHNFFQPFFTGIFLEEKLETSSRMFEFVFKMFAEGLALIPKGGIEEISKQLSSHLQKTTIQLNTKVKAIQDTKIVLEDGNEIKTDYTIIATEASSLISNLKNQQLDWKSCDTLYFTTDARVIQKPFIGLVASRKSLINNIFYHSSVEMTQRGDQELLSVTVVKDHSLSEKELIAAVTKELQEECGIKNLQFLKRYQIDKALPQLHNFQYEVSPSETQLKERIFLAGDVQLNASLNAAMLAGEAAALGVLQVMGKTGVIQ
ncbi:MAG: oxidoreductase [Flavobacteriaceae bacterium]|nr:oxidoreductase [Flavobacteriaceae bacterium]|tara:strand:- start:119837 stop:121096 length:1260 start_codon:yes stop_codon:yes gene_type:complete